MVKQLSELCINGRIPNARLDTRTVTAARLRVCTCQNQRKTERENLALLLWFTVSSHPVTVTTRKSRNLVQVTLTIAVRVLASPLLTTYGRRGGGRDSSGRFRVRMLEVDVLFRYTGRSSGLRGHGGGSAGVPAPAGPGRPCGVADQQPLLVEQVAHVLVDERVLLGRVQVRGRGSVIEHAVVDLLDKRLLDLVEDGFDVRG